MLGKTRWLTPLVLLCVGRLAVAQDNNSCGSRVEDQACLSKEYKWIPEAEHRCNIVRMTLSQLLDTFGPRGLPSLHPEPLVILNDPTRNEKFRNLVSRVNIFSSLPPNFEVTLSSSNSFSQHRRTIPLTQYLEEILETGETTPDQLSNETW
jgi:hypothetical protein